MNYLAHIYLSGENEDLKIGNFIADSVKGKNYKKYPEVVQQGILLHRKIDSFTDSHPTVFKSTHRLFPIYSHYASVIIDVLYDHFLAKNWKKYHDTSLAIYVDEFYYLLKTNFEILPKRVQKFYPYMVSQNWLLNYATIEGIEQILFQMNGRVKSKIQLHHSIKEFKEDYTLFENEFTSFFEELIQFSENERKNFN
ncbi:acyl carrier protein phosphodiesterase [Mesonia maritima]|uniref:Acyl carrier protein phosphodiesterase n=1 Tax=Mesonia maritima TaxID=1793873 RepID=A0ABU1K715_9FLAO|nr:acyl carrier protein phosphodiesterase [Mesonia maritima]MDR6301399.1 acyl carrier protein phosphodiesterase [Mesonia maritima]